MNEYAWAGLIVFVVLLVWRIRVSKKNTGTLTGGLFGGGGSNKPPTHHK